MAAFATYRVIRGCPRSKSTWAVSMSGGKWPRHGEGFDATMNTIRIQADGENRSINGGCYRRRCRSKSPRGFVLLHPTVEGQNGEHAVNYQAQWTTGTRSQRDRDSDSRQILGISHLNQAVLVLSDNIPGVRVDGHRA